MQFSSLPAEAVLDGLSPHKGCSGLFEKGMITHRLHKSMHGVELDIKPSFTCGCEPPRTTELPVRISRSTHLCVHKTPYFRWDCEKNFHATNANIPVRQIGTLVSSFLISTGLKMRASCGTHGLLDRV
ncbi:hypothetical protein TWF569_006055 [Orbilia oligospora]|uniref:Uncharacterized protein n=1 Tax=Orbilia oligospora TaxID=2813651 RepID=A0A7C8J277_ORBOL|nr:hypothetical protein TWF102_002116 [Orbilia oligospora]KAF3088001.1 hypothetical protein TWF706_010985 [Orbilia oligospora]KAF3115495.1 hypothetical protein TWF103_010904 [Orbilia oligospora]KAF3143846.1 hypothetical protein TWF594_004921 [Orbilia oligospora]KAF3147563.1 hypothetical protein TWF569_006055 [Orbilia oligospora]